MIDKSIACEKTKKHIDKQMAMLNKKTKKNKTWFKGFSISCSKTKSEKDMDDVESQRVRNCYELKLKRMKNTTRN